MNGKGSRRRPEDDDQYRKNYDQIFGKPKAASDPIHLVSDVQVCQDCNSGCVYCSNQGFFYPGWYFWDETWSRRHGPFHNKELAQQALIKYAKEL